MKSLIQFNAERAAAWEIASPRGPVYNGIACPKCEHELQDSRPNVVLASSPPQRDVICPQCGFTGTRFA